MNSRIDCGTYNVYLGNFSTILNDIVADADFSGIAVLVDKNTAVFCLPKFAQSVNFLFSEIIIAGEEINKNLPQCELIWKRMIEIGMDRKSLLILLGGGVIGDMGGFCASLFMRGIKYIQIPTSLLAQVDASVGGKVGIDFNHLKNYLGVFKFPEAVIIDELFLKTLPERHLKNGFAEIIKHALILDKKLWQNIQEDNCIQTANISAKIYQSICLKQSIVIKDPEESGLRKILNYGHSIGHALESLALENKMDLLHGEAIIAGMICSAYIAYMKGGLSHDELTQISGFCKSEYEKIDLKSYAFKKVIQRISYDKKNEGQLFLFTLLNNIGNCKYDQHVNSKDIKESFNYYLQLYN